MKIAQRELNIKSRTPLSEGGTITPPCSPPFGAQVVEMEEGELLDETQELPEMSDISDDEDSVREYEYDTNKYYRGGRESGAEVVLVDSPASPDFRQEVTGSPVRIIPRSPVQEDCGVESLGEEEDLDEDILYLRLIALRSLAVEEKKEQGQLEENKLAIEMQELLDEAEVAAKEEAGDSETALISEIITIDDDDEDPISEMKLNLHESYMKFKKSVEVVDMTASPSYSPTQSPSLSLSPTYIAPGDSPSPPTSPRYSYPVVDLTSPYSPSDDACILPPLPPLPPPPTISPPPPPPPSFPDPVPTTIFNRNEEPLPPGEDSLPYNAPPPPGPPSDPPVPQDMDIDSGEEAESQFFLNQQNLFPASVWDFSNQQTLQGRQKQEGKNEEGRREQEREGQVKRRRTSSGSEKRIRKISKNESEELEEDEDSLRLLLLAQVSRGKAKSKLSDTETVTEITPNQNVTNMESDIPLSTEKAIEAKENIKPKPAPVSKATKLSKAKAAPKVTTKKRTEQIKPKAASRIVSRTSSTSSSPARRDPPTRRKQPQIKTKISKADQKKFFPNLSKRVVVPLAPDESDSEDEEPDEVTKTKEPTNAGGNMFGLDLEAFLKQARNSVKTDDAKLKSNPISKLSSPVLASKPKYIKKKIALTPQLKAKALQLTLADKKKLISAQISHLSRSKQMEYKRLKEILAKKEKEKVLKEKKKPMKIKTNVKNGDSNESEVTESNKAVTDKSEDDESALRLQLLQNMKTSLEKKKEALESQKPVDGNKGSTTPKKSISGNVSRDKITVMLSGETRNVEVNGESVEKDENNGDENLENKSCKPKVKEGVDPVKMKTLETVESGVVSIRKTLSTSLFKLSAYMSQLQKETIGVESGIKYAEELRRQLKETEELVAMRQEKVDNLREVIRESHKQITMQRQDMTSKEDDCRSIGMEVYDGEYNPPADGAENIRKKLEMIRNTALKVKTTTYATTEPGAVSTGSIVGGSVGGQADYRSPLEHLNQSERLDTVKLDHSKELCRFELAGKCLDEACQFQHCS